MKPTLYPKQTTSFARRLIEDETGETLSDGELPLGAPEPKSVDVISIHVSGEGAGQLREFLAGVAKLCNSGSSRRLMVTDRKDTDPDSDNLHWDFDGDGDTRLEIVDD